jgi:hypothetical protein
MPKKETNKATKNPKDEGAIKDEAYFEELEKEDEDK